MRLLRLSPRSCRRLLKAIAINWVLTTGFTFGFTLINGLVIQPRAIAQSITTPALACSQITNRRYVVLSDRPANLLPQLPQFLAIAAVPCSYLNVSITFFGGFDNAKASIYRASQLRQLGLDAIVHSFSAQVTDIPDNLQATAILIEPSNDPNLTIQQVRSLTGKSAFFAVFNNRSVILAELLSSQTKANAIATTFRNQGLAAQVISTDLIASSQPPKSSVPPNSNQTAAQTNPQIIYRVLIPNTNANTLKQVRELAPDAFITIFKGKSYIQVRTYADRGNAHRERDRLNARFSGVILLQD